MAVGVKDAGAVAVQHAAKVADSRADLADRLVTAGFVLAGLALLIQTSAHLFNAVFLDYEVKNFDADVDGYALSWASAVATFGAAIGAALLGLIRRVPDRSLLALAATLTFLSLDDVTGIHERLGFGLAEAIGAPAVSARALWPALYLPLLVFVVVMVSRLAASAPQRAGSVIRIGVTLLGLALAAEGISALWWDGDDPARPLIDDLEVVIEEGAELVGWILLATGMLASACSTLLRAPARSRLSPSAPTD